jgi:hypothetical protein
VKNRIILPGVGIWMAPVDSFVTAIIASQIGQSTVAIRMIGQVTSYIHDRQFMRTQERIAPVMQDYQSAAPTLRSGP